MQRQSEDGALPDIRTIGFFEVNELDAEPTRISSKMGDFLKPIAWKKINQIHNGVRVEVGKNYMDFNLANLDQIILSNTERIERAVGHFKPNSKDKLKIFARTAVLRDLVKIILQPNSKANPKDFEFVFNKDKKELKIWTIKSCAFSAGFGPFVEKTLTTEDEMLVDEEVRYGYQSTYQLTELSYPEFVVYTSKEIDAIDNVKKGGEEFPIYEIKSCFNWKKNWIGNILIRNVAFTDRKVNLIIGELECQGETSVIKQVRVFENIEPLDASKLAKACREELGKILKSILKLAKDFPNGTLSTSYQGIHFNKPDGKKHLIARPDLKNGTPKGHDMHYAHFYESDVQYLLDPNYEFNSTWPCRDSQNFENFLEHGFTNRKKENYVFLFSERPQNNPEIRTKLEEEGYVYDQSKSNWLRNEYSEVLDCFVLKETLPVEK